MKTCPACGKTSTDFYPDSTKKGGFSTYCRSCTSEHSYQYYHGRGWKIHLLCAARRRAKTKGIPFTLTADDFEIPEFCPILGIKLVAGIKRGAGPDSASLDRIDLALGYVAGNIQIISMRANRMKSDATADELHRFADWVNKEFPLT
jgi:hypothetical protein